MFALVCLYGVLYMCACEYWINTYRGNSACKEHAISGMNGLSHEHEVLLVNVKTSAVLSQQLFQLLCVLESARHKKSKTSKYNLIDRGTATRPYCG